MTSTTNHPSADHPHSMPAYFLGRPVTVYVERFRRRPQRVELPRAA